jgi:hypothetical protein
MRRRLLNLLIAIDQIIYVLLTLGHGSPDETLSAAAYRLWLRDMCVGAIFQTDHRLGVLTLAKGSLYAGVQC